MNHLHREIALLVGISLCLGAHIGKYKFLTEEWSSSKFSYWLDKVCPNTAQHTNIHLFCQYSGSRKHKPTKNHTTILANLSEYLCLTPAQFQCQSSPGFWLCPGSQLTSQLLCTAVCMAMEKYPSLWIYEDGTENGYMETLKNEAYGNAQLQNQQVLINTI